MRKKSFLAMFLIAVLSLSYVSNVSAKGEESQRMLSRIGGLLSASKASFDVKVDGKSIIDNSEFGIENRSFVFNADGSVTISEDFSADFEIPNEIENNDVANPNTTKGVSDGNTFWRGYVNVTYTVSGRYIQFTSVSGKWTQQRGSAVLSNRKVYYAISTMLVAGRSDTKYPSSNEFYYSTGYPWLEYGHGTNLGANSSARYSYANGNGPAGTIEVNAHIDYAEIY